MTDRLTDAELDELEAVAKAATQGEWRAGKYSSIVGVPVQATRNPSENSFPIATVIGPSEESVQCAAHIAAFDPPTAQALVREVRELRGVYKSAISGRAEFRESYRQARAENARLREALDDLLQCVDEYGVKHWDHEDAPNEILVASEQARAALQSTQPVEGGSETDFKALYEELLYAVETCWGGETRHQTALRYITEAERRPAVAASESPAQEEE